MSKILKTVKAVAAVAAAGAAGVAIKAKTEDKTVKRIVVEEAGDSLINTLVSAVGAALPMPKFENLEDYESENFYAGHDTFIEKAKRGAKWKFGYARESLTPDDYLTNRYYIAGYLHFPPNAMTGVLDDIAVRAICLDDSSGRGAVAFAVIDCVGLSGTDVREIRERLEDFAKEKGIASINVSAVHCHSGVDTQGLWGDLPAIVKNNVKAIKKNRPEDLISGKNKQFMQRLFELSAKAITDAYNGMKAGKLSFAMTDKLNHNRDKRPPDVIDKNLLTLHFEPTDGSRQTVAAFFAAHPVSVGYNNTECSGDFIYYMEEEVNKADKNFIYFQGAELAVATNGDFIPEDIPDDRSFIRYGRAMGRYVANIPDEEKTKLSPIINIRHSEAYVPCKSPILRLAGQAGIINNKVLRSGKKSTDLCIATEIGFVEMGNELAFALVPGEIAAEIQLGGAPDEITSYNRRPWNYPTLNSMTERHLTVIGLCNDAIGYILPDNDFGSMLAKLHYEESVSTGNRAGSCITIAFKRLTEECDRLRAVKSKK